MAQLMPLPLTVSCFSKIQICFTFLVPAYLGSPGQRAVKRVCVCVILVCMVVVRVTRFPKSWNCVCKISRTWKVLENEFGPGNLSARSWNLLAMMRTHTPKYACTVRTPLFCVGTVSSQRDGAVYSPMLFVSIFKDYWPTMGPGKCFWGPVTSSNYL